MGEKTAKQLSQKLNNYYNKTMNSENTLNPQSTQPKGPNSKDHQSANTQHHKTTHADRARDLNVCAQKHQMRLQRILSSALTDPLQCAQNTTR
jgi:hypothetical protein